MDTAASRQQSTQDVSEGSPDEIVTCHETRPGRFVFVERSNADGWIATDVSVDLIQ